MILRVDMVECPESGNVVDYVLLDEHGKVVARLGPDGATEDEKTGLLTDLGLVTGCRSGASRIRWELIEE